MRDPNKTKWPAFFCKMLRSSVVEITSCVHTKTTIVFNLGEWQNNINLDFEE